MGAGVKRRAGHRAQCPRVGFPTGRGLVFHWAVRPSKQRALGRGVGAAGLGRSQVGAGSVQPLHLAGDDAHSKTRMPPTVPSSLVCCGAGGPGIVHLLLEASAPAERPSKGRGGWRHAAPSPGQAPCPHSHFSLTPQHHERLALSSFPTHPAASEPPGPYPGDT